MKAERLLFLQGGVCFYCRRKLSSAKATIEHVIPSSMGGKGDEELSWGLPREWRKRAGGDPTRYGVPQALKDLVELFKRRHRLYPLLTGASSASVNHRRFLLNANGLLRHVNKLNQRGILHC